MKRMIMILVGLAITAPLWAQVVMEQGVSYTPPTARTDGTPLPISELAGHTLHCGTSSGNYIMALETGVDGFIARAEIIASLGLEWDVEYFCALTATDTGGRPSAHSAEVNFTVAPAPPGAPALVIQ